MKGYYLQLAKEKIQDLSKQLVSLQKEKSFKSASYLPISIVSIITGVYLGFLPARLIGWDRLTTWETRGLFEFWFATVASIGSGLYGGVKLGKTATKHLSIETENNIASTQTKIKDIERIIALLEK